MLSIWNFFLEKRQFTYLLTGVIIVAGLYALAQIPKESAPSIDIPYGIVSTAFPGASAIDTETLVTTKLENEISNLANIDKITSTSGDGVSIITVQFAAHADTNQSIQALRDAVSKVAPTLPTDVKAPNVSKINFNDTPILVASISGDMPATELSKLGTTLSDQLANVTGVSRVDVAGVPDRQVTVVVAKESLELYGLRLVDIINAIAASNAAIPAGTITMDGVNYDVNFKGGLTDPSQISEIAVGTKSGAPIYLRDIAFISDGLAPATTYSRVSIDGQPSNQAISVAVYKQAGGNVAAIANAVRSEIERLKDTTLKGTTVLIPAATDQGKEVGRQLGELTTTGLETVVLVMLVLLLTIGWRESVVAALSIPLSFLISFIGLYMTGNTLNFISLFALILAVGILVDSGIVVTEAIHARMSAHGHKPIKAARAALKDYAWPLIAGTMATVAVFAPLFFLSGIIGKFIAGIPYTIIFVLLASVFVALGIVPLIAIAFTKKSESPNRLEVLQEEYTHKATVWYKEKLRYVLERRRWQNWFIGSLAALFFATLMLPVFGVVQTIFFAQENADFVYLNITTPRGTTLAQTDLVTRQVEEILYDYPEVASFNTTVGQSSALAGAGSSGSNQANITVNLPPERTKTSTQVAAELQQRLSVVTDATVQVFQLSSGPASGAPIQIRFIGNNLDDLATAAERGKQVLSAIPGVTNVMSSTQNNGTAFDLTIDRAKATAVGLNTQVVAQTLRAAINGTRATSIPQATQDIDVVVKLNLNPAYTDISNTTEATIDSIRNLSIQGANGPVLLGSVLQSSLGVSNATIAHDDKRRVETVTGYPDATITATGAVSEFQKKITDVELPEGVVVSYGGESEDVNESFMQMFVALIAGLVLMFMILVISFNSFRYTWYLLLIVPLSLIGVFDGLAITGQPLSFPSMLGFIALGGVIINHAIILMDSMIHALRTEKGKALIDVVVDASATRLRPIFLTTITTVVGMIPLARSSDMWGPLAFTIMFGLSFAIILTLVLVPVLFYRAPHKIEEEE